MAEFKICLICGKEFKIPFCRKESARYCSNKCRYIDKRGKGAPFYGRHHTEEVKEIFRQVGKKKIPWNIGKKFPSASKYMKEHNPMKNPKIAKKMSLTKKRLYKEGKLISPFKDTKIKMKALKASLKSLKPNKSEQILINLINQNNLSYKFVGCGDFILGGKNPDFLQCNGQKKIIELFGVYWHLTKPGFKTRQEAENQRKEVFTKYGFSTLIVWEDELKDVDKLLDKIRLFEKGNIL